MYSQVCFTAVRVVEVHFVKTRMSACTLDAGGVFSGAPRIPVMSKGKTTNRFVTVQRAPEPADVWWENAATASHGGYRRVLSWLAYLILVAVSCGIQGLLTYLAEQVRHCCLAHFFRHCSCGCPALSWGSYLLGFCLPQRLRMCPWLWRTVAVEAVHACIMGGAACRSVASESRRHDRLIWAQV